MGGIILRQLSLHDLSSLARVSFEFSQVNHSSEGKRILAEKAWYMLMYYISKADWDRAEVILNIDPHFIFLRNTAVIDNRSVKISPLQYVVYLVDNHGLAMCQKYITDMASFQLYWDQIAWVNTRYDFAPFFRKYSSRTSAKNMGKAQAECLPMWVLIEQCTPRDNCIIGKDKYQWNTTEFNDPRPKGECIVELVDKEVRLFSRKVNVRYAKKSTHRLGKDYWILRESNIEKQYRDEDGTLITSKHDDSAAIAAAYDSSRYDNNHRSTVAIYHRLIKYRLQQQTYLIFSMVDKQKSLKEEVKQLYRYIDKALTADAEGFDSMKDRLFGITRDHKIRAAQTKVRVLHNEISKCHLSFFSREIDAIELTPRLKKITPQHVLKEIKKLKQVYMSFNDEYFLSVFIERVLETRLLYAGNAEQTFIANYNYITEVVALLADRLIKVEHSPALLNFLEKVKEISDSELQQYGGEDNGEHCLVNLFNSTMPAAIAVKHL